VQKYLIVLVITVAAVIAYSEALKCQSCKITGDHGCDPKDIQDEVCKDTQDSQGSQASKGSQDSNGPQVCIWDYTTKGPKAGPKEYIETRKCGTKPPDSVTPCAVTKPDEEGNYDIHCFCTADICNNLPAPGATASAPDAPPPDAGAGGAGSGGAGAGGAGAGGAGAGGAGAGGAGAGAAAPGAPGAPVVPLPVVPLPAAPGLPVLSPSGHKGPKK